MKLGLELRRFEQRKQNIIESSKFYRTFMRTIPIEEWGLARRTHQGNRASKAGERMGTRPGEADAGTTVGIRKTNQ